MLSTFDQKLNDFENEFRKLNRNNANDAFVYRSGDQNRNVQSDFLENIDFLESP